ncbi:Kinesin-like protein KIN-UA, partial [Cucurbita argyrosperma subsp. argyrosperma]
MERLMSTRSYPLKPIMVHPKTGDVSVPGATVVEIRNQSSFLEILRLGEAHRFAANTKLNTESSRSHAILMVQVKRSVVREEVLSGEEGEPSELGRPFSGTLITNKSKLVL